ncbi:MAG: gamma carbonic anhydrase family protein [Thermomicrobiales bacterium]
MSSRDQPPADAGNGSVFSLDGVAPKIAADAFIAPGAVIVGDVVIGAGSSVWFNTVIRGDSAPIRIGAGTNIQDGAVVHVDPDAPCTIGDGVTVGHGAIVHGTTVGDRVTIGMGAIVLSRSRIGDGAVIAAGAVVAEGAEVAAGALMMGVPAKEKRSLDAEGRAAFASAGPRYVANARLYIGTLRPAGTGRADDHGG